MNLLSVLEEYLGRISKTDNKFKAPIKAFQFNYDRKIITGVITSANIPDESFWFVGDEKEWRQRRKERIGEKYYELTEENLFKINQIKEREVIIKKMITEIANIANTFGKQITKEYIATKQRG